MNKKLLALAIGAAVAMPVAALADGPTLYGKINLSLENYDDSASDVWSVVNNASRIGVKGSAETGVDGLKGIYLAEFGLKADDGDANGWGTGADPLNARNIYAGLQGNFGTVLAGHVDTPFKTAQGKVDQFNDSTADISNYVAGDLRAPNAIAYVSPKIADSVTISVALWQGEGVNGADGQPLEGIGDAVSASVAYEKDGLYLALAMDKETPNLGAGMDLAASPDNYNDLVRLVAGYTTDSVEVGFLYQTAEGADTPSTNAEDTSMVLSGAYKTGDWKFKAQFGQTEGDVLDDTVEVLALGADYALGKATTLNALFWTAEDDGGTDDTNFGVGIEQRF